MPAEVLARVSQAAAGLLPLGPKSAPWAFWPRPQSPGSGRGGAIFFPVRVACCGCAHQVALEPPAHSRLL